MTPEQRAELEARVDRAVRRGELSQARADLVTLLEAFPDDARLQGRLEAFESAALPGELRPPRTAPVMESAPAVSESPEALAERLVQEGDLRGALTAYRRAVEAHPENELLQERLSELFEQVRAEAAAQPQPSTAAPLPTTEAPAEVEPSPVVAPLHVTDAPAAVEPPVAVPVTDAPAEAEASPVPAPLPATEAPAEVEPSPVAALPTSAPDRDTPLDPDPVARLEQLLERLQSRRRTA